VERKIKAGKKQIAGVPNISHQPEVIQSKSKNHAADFLTEYSR